MKLYSNTNAGISFADKTLRKLRREQTKRHEVSMLVYVEDSYAVLKVSDMASSSTTKGDTEYLEATF
jgi:GTPase